MNNKDMARFIINQRGDLKTSDPWYRRTLASTISWCESAPRGTESTQGYTKRWHGGWARSRGWGK